MDELGKIIVVRSMTDDDNESLNDICLNAYLEIAKQKILNRLYLKRSGDEVLPAEYELLQCEIAAYLINKRGAEGETSHTENGISRSYESGDVPESMLKSIIPFAEAF